MIARLLLLAALVALLAVLFKVADTGPSAEDAATPSRGQTGYYLRDAVVTEFGEDGAIRLEVAARLATEDTASKEIDLETVSVRYFALPGQRWHLTADGGRALPGMNTVELAGNVVMTGEKQSLASPAVVRTERLTLETATQTAVTDAPVSLGFGRYAIDATGMRADLKAETLRLESGVNGSFTP